jgi:hypothetical protein
VKFHVDFSRVQLSENIFSSVPDRDFSCAIFPFRNCALEGAIVDGMVFHLDSESFSTRVEGWSLWHSPRSENTIHFEAEVKMMSRGPVLMYHKDRQVGRPPILYTAPFNVYFASAGEFSTAFNSSYMGHSRWPEDVGRLYGVQVRS